MAKKDKRNRKGNSVFKKMFGKLTEILSDYWIRLLVICILCLVVLKICLPKFGFDFLSITEFFSAIVDETFGLGLNFLSTVGEFVGGVIGTILTFLSVIILTITFIQQKKVTEANIKQQDIQRFNDMFYELLRLYREQVESLSLENKEVVYKGKEFFDKGKEEVYNEYLKNDSVINAYMEFFAKNRSGLATYFRTLYRILEIIDKSPLLEDKDDKEKEGKERKEYAKIIRAQLTESELFFIRYNARMPQGENFIQYLNKYRMLKHLPFCDLFEYNMYRFPKDRREVFNYVFFEIGEALKDIFKSDPSICKKKIKVPIENNGVYDHVVVYVENKSSIEIQYVTKNKKWLNDLGKLLYNFAKEIFITSNFEKFNKRGNVEIKIGNSNECIVCVKTIDGTPLKISEIQ
ncbi:MAG: putative phage abortive infection protein [Bacteroidales bacterium]|nr:putative phage abortive infection protein [Bacteroidales bacterium]